jgi:ABC-type phosphate transport system substrate-binding protein
MRDVITVADRIAARFTLGAVVALVLVLALGGSRARAQGTPGYQVVVNAENPVTEISRTEVSRWFLKQSKRWPDGKVVVPLDQSSRSEVRAVFSLGIHRQSIQAIEAFWQKQIFSGGVVPPFVKVGDAEVMSYVASNTSAIGYVSGDTTLIPGVKAVKIKEKDPRRPCLPKRRPRSSSDFRR